jgi:predicted dehydrogenase
MTSVSDKVRLGIVGCGAIAEVGHLPASQLVEGVEVVALVDLDIGRVQQLAKKYHVPEVVCDYRAIADTVDAVIIATPPHLHLEHTRFFLERGVHVLCEKPLANSRAESKDLVDLAARKPEVKFAVAHVRRYFYYAQIMKKLVDTGGIGTLSEISADEGYPYNWPAYTAHAFQREVSPGGVMFDLGIHLLDLFLWLGGPISTLRYADDAIGGVESNAEAHLTFENGASGHIKLSRTCERSNRLRIQGSEGWAEASIYVPDSCKVFSNKTGKVTSFKPNMPQNLTRTLAAQLADFVQAIRNDSSPQVTAADGMRAIEAVEIGYQQSKARGLPKVAPLPGVVRWN